MSLHAVAPRHSFFASSSASVASSLIHGSGGTRVSPIRSRFQPEYPGPASAYQMGNYLPAPPQPSDTRQMGDYYVRGPRR